VRMLLDEFTHLTGGCSPDTQTPECPVGCTEQGTGGKKMASVVEVSQMRHVLILQGVQRVLAERRSVRAKDQQGDRVSIKLHTDVPPCVEMLLRLGRDR